MPARCPYPLPLTPSGSSPWRHDCDSRNTGAAFTLPLGASSTRFLGRMYWARCAACLSSRTKEGTALPSRTWGAGKVVGVSDDLPIIEFAFPGPLRDQLLDAIGKGVKTATSSLVHEYESDGAPLPTAGAQGVVDDSRVTHSWYSRQPPSQSYALVT